MSTDEITQRQRILVATELRLDDTFNSERPERLRLLRTAKWSTLRNNIAYVALTAAFATIASLGLVGVFAAAAGAVLFAGEPLILAAGALAATAFGAGMAAGLKTCRYAGEKYHQWRALRSVHRAEKSALDGKSEPIPFTSLVQELASDRGNDALSSPQIMRVLGAETASVAAIWTVQLSKQAHLLLANDAPSGSPMDSLGTLADRVEVGVSGDLVDVARSALDIMELTQRFTNTGWYEVSRTLANIDGDVDASTRATPLGIEARGIERAALTEGAQ